MTCPHCGFESSRVFHFCSGCGAAVPSGVAVPGRDPAAISSALRWGVLGATLALPPVGMVMGVIYMIDARVEQKELGRLWLSTGVALAFVYAALATWLA